MLNVEQAITECGKFRGLLEPDFRAGVRSFHRQGDYFGDIHRPVAHRLESIFIPVRVGNDVEGNDQPYLPGRFQRPEIDSRIGPLAQPALLNLPADCETLLGMNQGDIIGNEHIGFAYGRQILRGDLRGHAPIGPIVESPCAAKGAIPLATAGKLDGSARIEASDEVLVPFAGQIPRRPLPLLTSMTSIVCNFG